MVYALVVAAVLLFVVLVAVARKLPTNTQKWLIVVLSPVLAWMHHKVALTQLDETGFAASNRDPNRLAETVGNILAVLATINIGLSFKNLKYATVILGLVFALLPALYYLSA